MTIQININDTIAKSLKMLEKKMIGGITKESAERAVKKAAYDTEEKMMQASKRELTHIQGRHTMQLNEVKKAYIASLNDKDREILSLRKETAEAKKKTDSINAKLAAVTANLKKTATFGKIKTNPDGSEVYVKANKNGAKMKKTVIPGSLTADGRERLKEVDVELLDGSVRRTTYDVDGIRKRTYTNTTEQPVEILYRGGYRYDTKPVNTPKVKPAKPVHAGNPTVEYNDFDKEILISKQKYSDGTHIVSRIDRNSGKILSWEKKNSDGHFLESYGILRDGTKQHVTRKINKDGSYGWKDIIELEFPNGIKRKTPYSIKKDELTSLDIHTDRITFPKTSSFKRIDTEWLNGGTMRKMTVTMRNGDKYVLTDFGKQPANSELTPGNGLYVQVPKQSVKISKDGTISEMKEQDIRPWLETFHPDYNFALQLRQA